MTQFKPDWERSITLHPSKICQLSCFTCLTPTSILPHHHKFPRNTFTIIIQAWNCMFRIQTTSQQHRFSTLSIIGVYAACRWPSVMSWAWKRALVIAHVEVISHFCLESCTTCHVVHQLINICALLLDRWGMRSFRNHYSWKQIEKPKSILYTEQLHMLSIYICCRKLSER